MKRPDLTVSFWVNVSLAVLFAAFSLVKGWATVPAILFMALAYHAFNKANDL